MTQRHGGSLNRHAGLVPASTVQHIHWPLVVRHGGPRDKPGVTQVETASTILGSVLLTNPGATKAKDQ